MGIACDKDRVIRYIKEDAISEDNSRLETIRYINAYEIDRAYGGPEEGGWWYDTHEPISSIKVRNVEEAVNALAYLYNLHHDYYDDGISTSSVIHEGSLSIRAETSPAEYEPKERPHYE